METSLRSNHQIRFGAFEFDPHTLELRKQGVKLKLHGQPMEALAMLLEHPGELVTREELRKRLWPTDTFVDFEHSLNTAVKGCARPWTIPQTVHVSSRPCRVTATVSLRQ